MFTWTSNARRVALRFGVLPVASISLAAGLTSVVPAQATARTPMAGSLFSGTSTSVGTAYVVNDGSGTVTPIATATNTAGTPIPVGSHPRLHRDHPGRQDRLRRQRRCSATVTPITHRHQHRRAADPGRRRPVGHRDHPGRQDRLRRQRRVGHGDPDRDRHQHRRPADPGRKRPVAIAITPDGKTAYVANFGSGTVTPIATATNTAGPPIPVGSSPGHRDHPGRQDRLRRPATPSTAR